MLRKKTIKEEDPSTGKLLQETTRYDGVLKKMVQDDTVILIKFGDEEVLNMPIEVPEGKELHTIITIASVIADVEQEKEAHDPMKKLGLG